MVAAYPEIDIAPFIDHALLDPTATPQQLEQCCEEADRYHFATVCVYPVHVRQAANLLHNKAVKVCTVIGFPTGATTSGTKLYEAQEAIENGAQELDVVINLGWLKAGMMNQIHQELAEICEAAGCPVKAILEVNLLTEPEKRQAAEVCLDAGVRYLKTGTGWAGGVKIEDVRLLHDLTQDRIGLKAAGGIRTAEQALELILAGATRLGTSRGPEIIRQRDNVEV